MDSRAATVIMIAVVRSDRENEHQIEKQFGVGDAAMLVRHNGAKQRAAFIVPRHGNGPQPRN
jgi:hypothetical protein